MGRELQFGGGATSESTYCLASTTRKPLAGKIRHGFLKMKWGEGGKGHNA